ncbi:Ig-like domain (group 3) [Chitinophaga sp. CF118]|uniref:Ig-like domain-containing protein n=1 Tax=Chitinophaga sp. CF118 TaxID=1884367 RepID=UPI0008EF662E|nr:Ig-like domain-containing protein [Chitinophaga sp. CF118]SFD89922.1 Ig-like domain (group 3) [Chitinophaga sp. CF118]
MRLFLLKCLGITLLCCLYSIVLSAQTGPAGVNSGTVLWLDASDVNAGGATPTVGSTVTTWKDKSGNNHNATSSGTNTATYTSGGANSTPVIHFNRTSSSVGTGFTVSGLDIRAVTAPVVTIFAVYRQGTNDGSNQAVWGNDNGSQQRFFNSKWSTGTTDGSLSTGGTAAVIAGASAVGETRLVTGIYSGQVTTGVNTGASNASAVYINGKKLSTFTDMTAASSGQSVFKIGLDGDDNYFNGDVSEIIIYNRKLTDCELETVNRYLANKYTVDFINVGANYTLGVPINNDINGVGKPASACGGNYTISTASSDIVMVTNPSSTSTAGVVLTFANDRKGYASSSETPPLYTSRLTQKWRADLNGNIGTVDICFNLEGLGIDVSNSGNFALLIDKDGNFSDATVVSTGITIFVDRVCISNVSITKGDYFTLATVAATSNASSITSPNEGLFQKSAFTAATVVDNQIQVKGSDNITNGQVYVDTGFVSGDLLAWTAAALPSGVTASYNTGTGILAFTGTATAAQWQDLYRTVTFRTTSGNIADRTIRFVLGSVVSYTVGSKPHYYEYVTTPMNWINAKAAAATRTLYGLQGYLATSSSQIENDFIKAKLSSDGWVGASCNYQEINGAAGSTLYANQTAADGRYYWITGPEKGQAISTTLTNPVAVGSAFMNWNAGEPNNYQNTNEQFVQLYSTNNGKWNDLPLTSLLGYVVEYGGYASDVVLNIDYSRIMRSAPAAPVIVRITTDGGSSNSDKITNDATLVIRGTSPSNAIITLTREDLGGIGTTTANGGGNWMFDYTGTILTDGTYNFTAVATVASVESAVSTVFQVTIDLTAPAKPGTPALAAGSGNATNTQTPVLTGSAEPATEVTIYDGVTSLGTVTTDSTGKWTFTSSTLTVTSHNITVTATDIAGNVSVASDIFTLTVDVTAPATPAKPVLVGGNNGVINNNKPTITGTADANSTVIIFKDGVAVDSVVANASGNYTYTFVTALPDATYSITVKAKDAAGNVSAASPALSITVDTTAPTTPSAPVLVGGNNGVTNNNKPTITGSAEANSTVIIYKDGVAVDSVTADAGGNYTYTFTTALPDAIYSITVKDKDAAGNVSASSPALSITIDTGVPVTPAAPVLVGGNNGVINNNKPTITGIAEANTTVIIYKDGVVLDSVPADASGSYTYTFITALADGTYSITVKDKDVAGNVSASSPALSITIDTGVPVTPSAPVLIGGNNGVINTSKPTIQGVAEANSTVIIFKDGVAVDSVPADASGNYTYTFVTALPDATYSITVKDKDAAGNVSAMSPALSITVDTSAPVTPAAPVLVGGNNGVINNNKPTITGVAEANSTVIIFKDGVAIDSVTVDAGGNYTYTFITALPDATYSITVKDKDAAGNVSAMSPALSITVDTNAPVTPAAPVLVGGNNGVINDATPDIKGVAEANSIVTIYSDGVQVGTTTADASGNYTYTFTTGLTEGVHSITVTATDAAGNVSGMSPALNITIDINAPSTPAAPVLVGGNNGVINNNKPTITGSAEANSTVTIYSDGMSVGTTTADASGNYTYTFTAGLTDGAHAITVTATDAAGNVSGMSPALNITVDTTSPTTPPAPVLVGGINGVISNNKPTITGSAEANSTVIIYKGGVVLDSVIANASGNYTYTFATALVDGTYSITVKDKDAAGNVSAMSPALSITIDTGAPATPPAPVLVGGINGVINDATPDIRGVAEANSTVTIYSDGVQVGTTTTGASGSYTYTFTTNLTDGAHAITVTATDAAGNTSAASPALNIKVDTQAPATPPAPLLVGGTNDLTTDPTPDIKGSAEPNSTVTIYSDGAMVATVTADASGNYTYTFTNELLDGVHSVTVTATDAAGNTSAASPALNFTVDAHGPARPPAPVLIGGVNGVTADATPDISGKAEANSIVTIYSEGVAVGTAKADASGNYTYTFTTNLTDGDHIITVTATDAAGNISPVSPALNFSVDAHAPGRPTAPVLVGSDNGLINSSNPTITGKAEPNSTVTVYNNGVIAGTAPVNASGNYTFTFPTAVPDGPHTITVTATDAVGNISESSPALDIIIDTKAPSTPTTPILVDGINGVIKTNKPTIIGTAEANSTVTIYDGDVAVGTTTADANGNWTYTFDPAIKNGLHVVTVTATDAAGNTSGKSADLPFAVDSFFPAVPLPPRLPGVNGSVNTTTPAITGQGEPGTLITIYTDGSKSGTALVDANGNWTYTYNPPLSESVHNINVTASKLDGSNESGHSETVKLTIDLVGPTVKLSTNTANGTVVNGTVTVTATFSESVSEFSWDDVVVTNGKVTGFLQVSSGIYQIMISPAVNGTVTVTVPAGAGVDVIGNGNSASELLSLDMRTPAGISQVYPMPATDVINVRFDGITGEDVFVSMTNMAGQVLQNRSATIMNGVLSINVQRLPSGSYVLLVKTKKDSYNTTVVIAR